MKPGSITSRPDEDAQRASEERLRGTFENAGVGIAACDVQGRFLRVNQKLCEIVGYTREQLLQKTWQEITHPDDLAASLEHSLPLLRGEQSGFSLEKRYVRNDGSPVWVDLAASLGRDAAGRPAYVIAFLQDISERKRLEEELSRANARLELALRCSNVGIWENAMSDREYRHGRGYYVNLWEQFGYERPPDFPPDYATGMVPVHPDDRDPLEEAMRRYLTGETSEFKVESRVRHRDGSYRWVLCRGAAVRDAQGSTNRFLGAVIDITDLKQAEAAMRESERRFRTLAEALPLMVWTAGPDGATDYFNPHTSEYTGLTLEQLRGWEWRSTIHPEELPQCLELWTRSIATGEPYEIEFQVRRGDGAFRWHLARALALRDDSGRITKWFGSCMDIDDQKRAQEVLREAKETAEAANRAKDEFLANVSHEIRTPMNAILGMTELVLDTPLTGDQRQCLKTVQSAADNLLGLMNDLLDFSKIEAGKLELDPSDFSLRSAVADTVRALAIRAHKKGLELVCHVQPEVPDALVGDAARLRQVLLNLVGNAIKFTEVGEVVVRVAAAGDSAPEDEVGLRFEVSDTGIGITPEKQERVFGAFEQEDTSTTRRYGGTGLGLTIAARLVALMGGTITVDSRLGHGSTFSFTPRFGRQPHASEPVAARPPAQLRDLRVLIVDDNATNRRILDEWLRSWRMEPAAVGDGLTALNALWRAVSVGRPYSLVLLDSRMPDTDGLALAAKLREQAELAATRIILLTSGDRPGDLVRSRELRVEAHLFKPVQQEELLEAIYRVMSHADGQAVAARPASVQRCNLAPAPAAATLQILVAEDNDFNKQHLEGLLARRGHQVRLANNGREALALLGIKNQQSRAIPSPTPSPFPLTSAIDPGRLIPAFDLLLLDLQMPDLDGFQVVRAIRESERGAAQHLPVIALTARSRNEDRERCLAAGMDDYLAKPVRSAELFAAIERVVSSHRVPQLVRPDAGDGQRLLDPVVLLAACDDEAEGLRQMCQNLRSYLPGRLADVDEAFRTGDAPRLRVAAHKLCGLLSAFSTAAGGVASDLEDQAAGGRLDECRSLVEQLEVMAWELVEQVDGLSIEALQDQARAAGDRDRTASP
jgi:two-component system, sensor histidine kinase and response regulator